jgi:hypothetical protein
MGSAVGERICGVHWRSSREAVLQRKSLARCKCRGFNGQGLLEGLPREKTPGEISWMRAIAGGPLGVHSRGSMEWPTRKDPLDKVQLKGLLEGAN